MGTRLRKKLHRDGRGTGAGGAGRGGAGGAVHAGCADTIMLVSEPNNCMAPNHTDGAAVVS